jgi:hypothetical protein
MKTKKKMVFGKAACLIACVMMSLSLLFGCGEEPTLRVEMETLNGVPTSFQFVDVATGKKISYTTLIFKGQPVFQAHAMSQGVYLAFDESQYRVEGNTTTFSGGVVITPAAEWKYTITDAPECKPGGKTSFSFSACELSITGPK